MKKTFKKVISLFLSALIIVSAAVTGAVAAESVVLTGYCGDTVQWKFDTVNGELKIFGSGKTNNFEYENSIYYYSTELSPWWYLKKSIKKITIENGITEIGDAAFAGCENVVSVNIPSSVHSIGNSAFYGCNALKSITLPDGIEQIESETFFACISLENINIPSSVTQLGDSAFRLCTSLKGINIPSSIKEIPDHAFYGCSSLKEIQLHNGIKEIGEYAFSGCSSLDSFKFPAALTKLRDGTFSDCTSLEEITVPSTVLEIGTSVFNGCTALDSITLHDLLKQIGKDAFENTAYASNPDNYENYVLYIGSSLIKADDYRGGTNADEITIDVKDGTKIIADYAFNLLHNVHGRLETVNIPASVTTMSRLSFGINNSFKNINVASDNPNFLSENGVLYNKDKTALIAYPQDKEEKSFTVPGSVKSIEPYAFKACEALETVILPEGLESIGEEAFAPRYASSNISSINIPDTVNHIGKNAFAYSKLTQINLPEGLTEIAEGTFRGCFELNEVNIPDSVTTIGENAFNSCLLNKFTLTENSSLKEIGYAAFCGTGLTEIIIPDGVTTIADYAFNNCNNLSKAVLPESLTYLGKFSFLDTNLEEITIPEGVTEIPDRVFLDCENLKTINLHDGITYINSSAFTNTAYVNDSKYRDDHGVLYIGNHLYNANKTISGSYEIKPGTVTVTDYAFEECNELAEIIIPASVQFFGNCAFSNCTKLSKVNFSSDSKLEIIPLAAFEYCTNLKSFTVPGSVKEIGLAAFSNCTSLSEIKFVNNSKLKKIGEEAFSECTALTAVSLPSSLKLIGKMAFSGCEGLKNLNIPEGVETLCTEFAKDCYSLEYIHIPSTVKNIEGFRIADGNYSVFLCTSSSNETVRNYANYSQYIYLECNGNHSDREILRKPSSTSMKYGESIILHINENIVPENAKIEWTSSSNAVKLSPSDDGKSCRVESVENGNATVSVKITAENYASVSDSVELQSQVNFIYKIISFFKNLFGINRIISQSVILF
ncbi:MAG: leucine-rich repeat domain-containing protein [Clostridia bacterium]|nr:leucine-rich repeat domain-containing protein [Clostridia bacterium]